MDRTVGGVTFLTLLEFPMKVLIVDDSRAMRMMVRRTLRQVGLADIEVEEAENGAAGLAAARSGHHDLILSDWNMPEMSGIEFLRELRAEGRTTPFGLVTSEGSPDMRAVAMREGANFLIQKPFDAADFDAVIHSIR